MISLPIKVQTLGREASFCPASYQKLGFHRQIPLVDVLCLVCIGEEYGEVEALMITPLPDEAQGSLPSQVDWRSLAKVWSSLDRRCLPRGLTLTQRWEANRLIGLVRGSTSAMLLDSSEPSTITARTSLRYIPRRRSLPVAPASHQYHPPYSSMKDHGGSLCAKLQSTIYKLQSSRVMSMGVSRSFWDAPRHPSSSS